MLRATGAYLFLAPPAVAKAVLERGRTDSDLETSPGGLGGVEAGLVAGLIVFNVPAAMALASAVTFRLATFWWPILIGTCGFVVARQKKLL